MPIRSLLQEIDYFKPKLREIAKAQEVKRMETELMGKHGQKQPKNRR